MFHSFKAHADAVKSLAISPERKILASGSWNNRIKLWNLKTGNLFRPFNEHTDDVATIAISPSGRLVASGGAARTIRL